MSYYVFDAYGTLFNVHSAVSRYAAQVGPNAARVSDVWRTKQLEYTWTRSCMKTYLDFWQLTEHALDFALEYVPNSNAAMKQNLLDAYKTLNSYEEVVPVLSALKQSGAKTAILSNGSPDMLASAVEHAKLNDLLDDVFSVDKIATYKTTPKAYEMVVEKWDINPHRIIFQSSNRWD
ncbi:MAG: haloacid dehalogenase type II, partial [Nitratireductor sp.]